MGKYVLTLMIVLSSILVYADNYTWSDPIADEIAVAGGGYVINWTTPYGAIGASLSYSHGSITNTSELNSSCITLANPVLSFSINSRAQEAGFAETEIKCYNNETSERLSYISNNPAATGAPCASTAVPVIGSAVNDGDFNTGLGNTEGAGALWGECKDGYENATIYDTTVIWTMNGSRSRLIYIFDIVGNIVSEVSLSTNNTDITVSGSNPFTFIGQDLFNGTEFGTINLSIVDSSGSNLAFVGNINFTYVNHTYNITLVPNPLILNFYQDGSPVTTSGEISDINKSINFTNSSTVIVLQSLLEDRVNVKFGTQAGSNWTQYYEFDNNGTSPNETIEILQQSDWSTYMQITDFGGAPLKDVIVRAFVSRPTLNSGEWSEHILFGQRLTDDQGFTFFFADSLSTVYLTATKSGFEPYQALLSIGDESYTRDDPLSITLQQGDVTGSSDTLVIVKNTYYNLTNDIYGLVVALERETVSFSTSYYESLGYSPDSVSCDRYDRCKFVLESGLHFADTGSADILLHIYVDSNDPINVTISNINVPTQGQFEDFAEDVEDYIFNPLLWIGLIFLSLAIGYVVPNENSSAVAFQIGVVIISLISTAFAWVLFTFILGYLLRITKKFFGE